MLFWDTRTMVILGVDKMLAVDIIKQMIKTF